MHEFIATEVLRVLLEDMPDLFGTVKERLTEMMDEHMRTLLVDLGVCQFGAHTLTVVAGIGDHMRGLFVRGEVAPLSVAV